MENDDELTPMKISAAKSRAVHALLVQGCSVAES